MKKDDFGNRMKMYEGFEASRKLMPLLPICVRLDGRAFSKFTKGLERPFDHKFAHCMQETTKYLIDITNARVGYTQSDEISLILYQETTKSETFFGGKIQKINSILASAATGKFISLLQTHLPEKADKLPMFDCRVWNVPTLEEACNVLLWRELDATRNSIQAMAQSLYSHKQLMYKDCLHLLAMIYDAGKDWHDLPLHLQRGSYFRKFKMKRPLTSEELEKIPPKHRPEPGAEVERNTFQSLSFPSLKVVENRVEVIFFGQEPVLEEDVENQTSNFKEL